MARRDPDKSNKDIEQDKMRTKKDSDSKILAEKEKAIKTLLDSDNVVPPGTEGEAIQNIVEKNQEEAAARSKSKTEQEDARSKIKKPPERKRSPVRSRLGYRRFSPIRRSPIRRSRSPDRRRSPITFSPDRRRRSPDDRRRRSDSGDRKEISRRRLLRDR